MEYIALLLFATIVSADYYIDNANTSIIYAMTASDSGQAWETLSTTSKSLELKFSNSTGNYTINLDASNCYDQNYALGGCGTNDNCFVQIPFTGSGITMFVFNAGTSGMTASFSVDGGNAITKTIQPPSAALNYQVSNVTLYDIQGLQTGNHTVKMTVLDWNGAATSMKFDYARVNETLVAPPTTTSHATTTASRTSSSPQMPPTQTPTEGTSSNVNVGSILGATFGAASLCAIIAIAILYCCRRRKPKPQIVLTPESTFQVHPFPSEYDSPPPPSTSAHQRSLSSTRHDHTRSTILAAGSLSTPAPDELSQSLRSRRSAMPPASTNPRQHSRSYSADVDVDLLPPHVGAPLSDPEMAARYNLTSAQVDVVDRLRENNVPLDTVARVIEGFVSSNLAGRDRLDKLARDRSFSASVAPPPSYQS